MFTSVACTLLVMVWDALLLAKTLEYHSDSCDERHFITDSLTSLLWCVAVLLCQGVRWVYSATSLRIVAGMWFMTTLIIATVYRSNLKAMLIMPRIQLPFDNLQELHQSRYPLYTTKTSATHRAIANAPDDSPLGLLKGQIVTPNHEMVMARLFYGGHDIAIAGMSFSFRHHMNTAFSMFGFCYEYVMQGDRLLEGLSQALGFPKGSPLRPKADVVILRLLEGGLINHLVYRALPNSSHCFGPIIQDLSSTKLRAQGLQDFYGVFSVFAGGLFIAVLSFCVEVMTCRRRRIKC
ncbi:uncharacterized protein LOC135094215 [Scylla paramamosain]|uniref:uncharacterized protein LOC135094215 n=1 Tax=Scylla paramamosain TaxID=85552 RepID=UPI0030833380